MGRYLEVGLGCIRGEAARGGVCHIAAWIDELTLKVTQGLSPAMRWTSYLTAYSGQSATRQDALWHKRVRPPNTRGTP
jgi:hypothetical protein